MKAKNVPLLVPILIFLVSSATTLSAETLTFTVSDVNDDANAWNSSADVWTNDMVFCGFDSNFTEPYEIGAFRFANVSIPKHAIITHAYLRVQAYMGGSGSSSFNIAGEAYDSTTSYALNPNIGQRAITAAQIAWSVPSAWTMDEVYDSPDIKTVVQEIVNRGGWTSGNAMGIQLRNSASSGGEQYIFSLEGTLEWGGSPAQLIVEFEEPPPTGVETLTFTVSDVNDDANAWNSSADVWTNNLIWCGFDPNLTAPYEIGAFRFANVSIPKGAIITHAYLRVQAYYDGSGSSSFNIAGEAYDSTTSYTLNPYIGQRAITSAQIAWSVPSAWAMDEVYDSPDIKTVVQEIVNRGGWTSGNAMGIQLRNSASSGGEQYIYSLESAPSFGASPAQLIVEFEGDLPPDGVKSENYIPGATNTPSLVPNYLNDSAMYYPAASGGLCWASATADILAYWDRNAHSGVKYWNLIDNGTAPLLQSSLPAAPGHDEADVKSVIAWLAHQYYGLGRTDEDVMIEEIANSTNGLAFNATYHGPVSSSGDRTTFLGTIKTEIDAGRPISLGSWGTYFGGVHQVPVIGYKEMSNTVNSTVYIHRNTGGTQSEYVNFYASSWGNLDMDQIVPGGTPVDGYESQGDNSSATTVALDPDDTYNFRQTHNFSVSGDADWIRLSTVSNRQYTIETVSLGANCDSVLALFQSDGVTQITQDDNGGSEARASKIIWNCWTTGTVFVRVTDRINGYGHAANYDLEVSYAPAVNHAPTDIALSNSSVAENQPSGTAIGSLSSTDSDIGNTFVYTLVSGAGNTDNSSFTISGNTLQTATSFDYEAKNNYTIRMRTTDQGGLWIEKIFPLTISDIEEPPPVFNGAPVITEGSAVLKWSSIVNNNYSIYYSTNLLEGFSILSSNLTATPPENVFTDSVDGVKQKFWKIQVEK